jgi:hypothetical protein
MSASESNVDHAWTKFYVQYGRAMLAWALIESELATLFSLLTRIPPNMAVQIFYSPRSSKGRTEIFKSALTVCKTTDEIRTFTRSLIKKADHYSDCRNMFAHDQPLLHQQSFPAVFDIKLVDAKGQFQNDETKKQYLERALSTGDITDIADQFMELANLIRDSWVEIQGNRSPSLDKLRKRLSALPNLPRPKDQSQPPAKPKNPPQSSGT